jgi:hypothetical protein
VDAKRMADADDGDALDYDRKYAEGSGDLESHSPGEPLRKSASAVAAKAAAPSSGASEAVPKDEAELDGDGGASSARSGGGSQSARSQGKGYRPDGRGGVNKDVMEEVERAEREYEFSGDHWECIECTFFNAKDRATCVMCNSKKPPPPEEIARRELMKRIAEDQLAPGDLAVRLLKGKYLLDMGQTGSVYAVVFLHSDKGNKFISQMVEVEADGTEVSFDEDVGPFHISAPDGERLSVHIFRRDRLNKSSELVGFGDIRLDHPSLNLNDGTTKRVQAPLKFKEGGVVKKLYRSDPGDPDSKSQAEVVLLISFKKTSKLSDEDAAAAAALRNNPAALAGSGKLDVDGLGVDELLGRRPSRSLVPGAVDEKGDPLERGRGDSDLLLGDTPGGDIKLKVKLVKCSNLLHSFNGNDFRKTSPYVAFCLARHGRKPKKPVNEVRSKVVPENLNPEFNEEIGPFIANDYLNETLYMEVRDANATPHRIIGMAEIKLDNKKLNLESGATKGVTVQWKSGSGNVTLTLQLFTEYNKATHRQSAAELGLVDAPRAPGAASAAAGADLGLGLGLGAGLASSDLLGTGLGGASGFGYDWSSGGGLQGFGAGVDYGKLLSGDT